MTETMREVAEKTAGLFSTGEMKVPEPPLEMKRRLEALDESGLQAQKAALLLDMRAWQAEKMGFRRMNRRQAAELLMGSAATHDDEGNEDRTMFRLEYYYDHHQDKECMAAGARWSAPATDFWRIEKPGQWYRPPFMRKEAWRVRVNVMDQLRRQIPYGVLLKIAEAKKLKIFNSFIAVAPVEAWRNQTKEDPIILAGMDEIYRPSDDGWTGGREEFFFLAQWA